MSLSNHGLKHVSAARGGSWDPRLVGAEAHGYQKVRAFMGHLYYIAKACREHMSLGSIKLLSHGIEDEDGVAKAWFKALHAQKIEYENCSTKDLWSCIRDTSTSAEI